MLSAPAVCRLPSAISRRPRFPVTGYPLHVVQRGNDRQPCFFAEADYVFHLDLSATLRCIMRCKFTPTC